jgi:hypothetical protein
VATLLTEDDLTELAHDADRARDPRPVITELAAIAEGGRLVDEADASYALGLASDLAAEYGDGDEAISLARRALAKGRGSPDENWLRGQLADLLLRLGYDDEGMVELRGLRPLLTRDEMASRYVIDALVQNGRDELAEEWLTTALTTAVDIVERAEPDSEAEDRAYEIEYGLARRRRIVRHDLGLPPDDIDRDIDELDDASPVPDMTFWPEAAFDRMIAAFPEQVEALGSTWDEHRTAIERALQQEGPLPVEVATPELLRASLAGEDLETVEAGPLLEWPPGRNEPCWCGSRTKYKKCCLPRTRS